VHCGSLIACPKEDECYTHKYSQEAKSTQQKYNMPECHGFSLLKIFWQKKVDELKDVYGIAYVQCIALYCIPT